MCNDTSRAYTGYGGLYQPTRIVIDWRYILSEIQKLPQMSLRDVVGAGGTEEASSVAEDAVVDVGIFHN